MKGLHPNLWGATSAPEFPLQQEAMSEIIFLLTPPSLFCLPQSPQAALEHTLNKSLICESSSQHLLPGGPAKTGVCAKLWWKSQILKQRADSLARGSQQAKFGKKTCFRWLTESLKKCEGTCQPLQTGKFHTKTQISPCLEKPDDPATLSLRSLCGNTAGLGPVPTSSAPHSSVSLVLATYSLAH